MAKIDLEKFVCGIIEEFSVFKDEGRVPSKYKEALAKQGLEYKNGSIVEMEPKFTDGDILVCGDDKRPFIFKGFLDKFHPTYPVAYCGITVDGRFQVSTGDGWWTDEEVQPATKEQRDTLFAKIKEAGYEWDAEKKELRKVKKAPQKFMVGDTIKYNGTEYKITEITPNGYKVYALTYDEDAASLISFSAPAILVEQKPAWSEEDEYYYGIIQYILNNECVGKTDKENAINWFNSLKDRVLPQSKQEWSEEDEKIIKRIDSLLYSQCKIHGSEYEEIHNWLKSLRPQKHWKPTEEQLIDFETAINDFIPSSYKEMRLSMENLLGQLKAL